MIIEAIRSKRTNFGSDAQCLKATNERAKTMENISVAVPSRRYSTGNIFIQLRIYKSFDGCSGRQLFSSHCTLDMGVPCGRGPQCSVVF